MTLSLTFRIMYADEQINSLLLKYFYASFLFSHVFCTMGYRWPGLRSFTDDLVHLVMSPHASVATFCHNVEAVCKQCMLTLFLTHSSLLQLHGRNYAWSGKRSISGNVSAARLQRVSDTTFSLPDIYLSVRYADSH